ncbi:hypothetical protein CEQ15_11665 [Chryseobacterium indologenes]|uniref:hypothetical protein n=1 Tax=Chryseobacterium indologenes TaxID=253 RepID=UPI000B51B09F|nr:hypothetical protein [Chryseobacterium indologenes]ASE62102.1 hypothetical protein CEQ15_11665 [Chryseobacterium indologenes]
MYINPRITCQFGDQGFVGKAMESAMGLIYNFLIKAGSRKLFYGRVMHGDKCALACGRNSIEKIA